MVTTSITISFSYAMLCSLHVLLLALSTHLRLCNYPCTVRLLPLPNSCAQRCLLLSLYFRQRCLHHTVLYSQYSYVLSSALPTSRLPSTCMHFHQYCLLMSCFFPSTVCPFVSIVLALPTNFVLCTFVCSFISTLHVVKYFVSNLTHQRLFQFTIFGFRVSWIHSTLKETVSQTYNPLVILIFLFLHQVHFPSNTL